MASTSLSYEFANIDVDKIIRDAFAQCGRSTSLISGWQYAMANESLNFLMTSWLSKRGLNLFTVEQDIIEIIPNQYKYPLPLNTSKILECTLAKANQIVLPGSVYKASGNGDATTVFTKTPTSNCFATNDTEFKESPWIRCSFPTPQPIQYVGILASSDSTIDDVYSFKISIQCSFSSPDIEGDIPVASWMTLLSLPRQNYYRGQIKWFSLPFTQNAPSWRILSDVPYSSLNQGNLNINQILLDIPYQSQAMNRVGRDIYTYTPTNNSKGTPSTYYIDRNVQPTLNIYQTPGDTQWQFFVYNRVRSIQDAGAYTNSLDMTPRFLEAATTGLAARLSRIYAPDKMQALQGMADMLFAEAAREDTENVDMQISLTNQGGYGS